MEPIVQSFNIQGKDVWVVEDHHHALMPWAKISAASVSTPYLLTMDYHTDTHDAFQYHAYYAQKGNLSMMPAMQSTLCMAIKRDNPNTVAEAIEKLRHDEHIDAAIKANILSQAYVIQLSDRSGTRSNEESRYFENHPLLQRMSGILSPRPPFTYTFPHNKIFVIPHVCAVGCQRGPHNDECLVDHANQILEDIYLNDQINIINTMSLTAGIRLNDKPYILDIDLDFFRTSRSINPTQHDTFYNLIKGALGVTIAKESVCVEMLRLEGEMITSAFLLEELLSHIGKAMTN